MKSVLVQMAGMRRNARGDPLRPGLALATRHLLSGKPADEVWVITAPSDQGMRTVGRELVADIKKRRPRKHCRELLVNAEARAPEELDKAREQLSGAIAKISDHYSGHRENVELVVSYASGLPSQWLALLRGFVNGGFSLRLASLEDSQRKPTLHRVAGARPPGRGVMRGTDTDDRISRFRELPPGRSVLLLGPTGAGKSESARKLHDLWKDRWSRKGDLVSANCAAFPKDLLESELFGHVKGAFTGATAKKDGLLLTAKSGTLLLDEIGELPPELQSKLLHVLDTDRRKGAGQRRFRPVGGTRDLTTDARLVFATNRDLRGAVERGEFREDLYARISTHEIHLPPVTEQRHRILLAYFERLESLADSFSVPRFVFRRTALDRLVQFVFDAQSVWSWGYRDVVQSAERLAFEACARQEFRPHPRGEVYVELATLESEISELRERWDRQEREEEVGQWARLSSALAPGALEKLSKLSRWEATYLLDAKEATHSNAEAWRWLVENQCILPERKPPINESAAFTKRWNRFRWAET